MPRILIIDDDKNLCALLSEIFLARNYAVQLANNGPAGLELAKEETPDVIVLDIKMPGMDGYEVCSILRDDPVTGEIPILMLTGMGQLPAALNSTATGPDE